MFVTNKLHHAVSIGFVVSAALAMPVMAQQTNSTPAAEGKSVERIQVTGSRIAREGAIAPSPVIAISGEELVKTGALNIGEVLSKLPGLATTFTLANSGRFIGSAGVSSLDLRGMGSNRTLVLVDGKRHVASVPGSSSVDTNTIPSSWIESVEIITGGASAVYGADAVTGVVNFKLKKDITGLVATATRGKAENNPYQNEKYTFSYGTDFADGRGNAAFAAEYNAQDTLNALDSPWTRTSYASLPYKSVTGKDRTKEQENDPAFPDAFIVPNAGNYALNNAGVFTLGGNFYTFNPDSSLKTVNRGTAFDASRCMDCDFLNLRQYNEIQPQFSRVNYNFKSNFDVTDDVNVFFDAKYVKSEGQNIGQPFFRNNIATNVVKRDNPFLKPEVQALMDANKASSIRINKMYNDLGRRLEDVTRETTRFVVGAEGMITEDWSGEFAINRGTSEITRSNAANVITANYLNALDAVSENGQIVCRSATARAQGCVPVNIMGDGAASEAARRYITTTSVGSADITQTTVGGSVSNSALFDLPAGPVGFATGVEYRKEESESKEDPLAKTGATFFNALSETKGSYDVKEAYFEVTAPLLGDIVLIDTLTADFAVRAANYSHAGSVTSWKTGLDWTITSELRARFTLSEAFRTPNIGEMFSGQGQSFANIADPCRVTELNKLKEDARAIRQKNCLAVGMPAGFDTPYDSSSRELLVGGNPNLKPETSRSATAGLVFQPELIEGLTFTVDYWQIDIEDAISSIGAQTILNRCVDSTSGVNNKFCELITRDPANNGQISLIKTFDLNISRSFNKGVDFEVGYDFDLFEGRTTLNLKGSRLLDAKSYQFQDEPGNYIDYAGVLGRQDLQMSFSATYRLGDWDAKFGNRYVGSVELYDPNALKINPNPSNEMRYGSYMISDVSVGYFVDTNLKLTLGIDNLFHRKMPGTTLGNGAGSAIYDNIGRFGYLTATYKF
jgi:outer membrane receptor protein involved in Fe transport